jgi:hypothetical protein
MTGVHRAVIVLGLLLAAFGALLGALGSSPVAAASIAIAGALFVVVGLWLRRRQRAARSRADVPLEPAVLPVEPAVLPVEPPVLPVEPPVRPPVAPDAGRGASASAEAASIPVAPRVSAEERERLERQALREAELARDAELDAIAEGLRGLRSRDLSATHIPEWKARIETWIDVDLKARIDRGEDVTPQAAEWMRDFGDIPTRDWRRHLLRHLRRLGYRKYQEGEW